MITPAEKHDRYDRCMLVRMRGAAGCTPSARLSAVRAGAGDCTPSAASPASGQVAAAALARRPGNCAPGLQCQPRSVVPDQAQVQVPALWTPIGALDPRRGNVRVAAPDDPRPPAGPGRCAPPTPTSGVADQRGHRREHAHAVQLGVVGQADKHELARARCRRPAAIRRDQSQVQPTRCGRLADPQITQIGAMASHGNHNQSAAPDGGSVRA